MGRSSRRWIDFDLFGHQMSGASAAGAGNPDSSFWAVDGQGGADPPFRRGACKWTTGKGLRRTAGSGGRHRLDHEADTPLRRQPGEQATLFMRDPSGNALEFKGFTDLGQVFAHERADTAAAPPPARTGEPAKFVTGSTMRHVVVMTATGSIGLWLCSSSTRSTCSTSRSRGRQELAAADRLCRHASVLFTTSMAIGLSIAQRR
jgi:extradiol dioxygenase family protein